MLNIVVVGAPRSGRTLPHLMDGLREPAQALPLHENTEPRVQLEEWLRSLGEDPSNYEERHGVWFRRAHTGP